MGSLPCSRSCHFVSLVKIIHNIPYNVFCQQKIYGFNARVSEYTTCHGGCSGTFFFLYTDDSIQGNLETCKQSSVMLNYEVKNSEATDHCLPLHFCILYTIFVFYFTSNPQILSLLIYFFSFFCFLSCNSQMYSSCC